MPGAPARLVISSLSEGLWLYWYSPSIKDDRAPVTSYRIRYRRLGTSSWGYWTFDTSDGYQGQTITGLSNRTTYEVQVAAVNRLGSGSWKSGKGTPQSTPTPAPEPPAGQSVSHNVGYLNVAWQGEDHSGRLWGQILRPQYCTGNRNFTVYWHGPAEARAADSWEAHVTMHGHVGRTTHSFRRDPGEGNFWKLHGTAIVNGDGRIDVQVRGRYGSNYGEWSRKSHLFCEETPIPANVTTASGQTIN